MCVFQSYKSVEKDLGMGTGEIGTLADYFSKRLTPNFASPPKAQPSGNKRIYICGLGASVGYERVERAFNTPRLKSQI